jgi:hypothetical protein
VTRRALPALALLALVTFTAPVFASRTILFYENECCRPITEGEFAILYVQGLKLPEPAQGWTVQTSAAALTALGHQPEGGWVLSRYLSEAVMARLLKASPFYRKPFTEQEFANSTTLVLIARARGVFPAADAITQGEFAVLLAQALRLDPPRGGWSPVTAVDVLAKGTPSIGPVRGWQPSVVLREAEMLQILAPTRFRGSVVDPGMEIAPVHAYSIFFGSAEIATEGHFGLFVVNALNVSAPPGGWTREKALAYIDRDLGVHNGYGWNPNSPLCAQTFEDALKAIEEKVRKGPGSLTAARPSGPAGSRNAPATAAQPSRAPNSGGQNPGVSGNSGPLMQELQARGAVSADRCALVPVRILTTLWQPPPPPPPDPLPASGSVPPER